mgnify:CR=1 FL=1
MQFQTQFSHHTNFAVSPPFSKKNKDVLTARHSAAIKHPSVIRHPQV